MQRRKHKQRVVIVGGGHNGLVCAVRLAAAGAPVLVLERGAGGARAVQGATVITCCSAGPGVAGWA